MDDKTLNSLDGSATYQEVSEEVKTKQIERNRKDYKEAIRTLIIRHESARRSASTAQARADKASAKLMELVEGGMQSFLTANEEIEKSYTLKKLTPTKKSLIRDDNY